MSEKCKHIALCTNPEDEGCLLGLRDYRDCNYLNKGKNQKSVEIPNDEFEMPIVWSGNSLGEIDLNCISYKKRPYIIGLVGPSNAGKTTLLATLYMLLRSGSKLHNFSFAGSNTLVGWENLAHFLTFKADNLIQFPPHTSRNVGRVPGMLHLKLKDTFGLLHDVLFTDAPGEWFSTWANKADDENAIGARWIDENSDAFLLFADCEAFKKDIGNARIELKPIAERLRNNINNRPLAFVWTKSDFEFNPKVKKGIEESICNLFSIQKEFNVSVKINGDNSLLKNIVDLFDWLLHEISINKNTPLTLEPKKSIDFFFAKR
jgi:hypothetical protein